jgi:hypothetical protein
MISRSPCWRSCSRPWASAQDIHDPQHCPFGCPEDSPSTNDLIIREIYILSSDDLTKFGDWAACRVTRDIIGGLKLRTRRARSLI